MTQGGRRRNTGSALLAMTNWVRVSGHDRLAGNEEFAWMHRMGRI